MFRFAFRSLKKRSFAGPRSSETVQLFFAALCGASVGLVIAVIQEFIYWLHTWCFSLPEGVRLSAGTNTSLVRLALVPALGGLLVGAAAWAFRRWRLGEIVDPVEANALHGGRMSMMGSLRLLFSTILSNAAGASVGMEAGYSQYGASVFSSIGQYFKLRRADMRIFVASGAAAAIAAAYNAPLAGAFYGFELILGTYSIRALAPVGVAALAGVLTERVLIDPEPTFTVGQTFHFVPAHYLLFACVGALAAGVCVLSMLAVNWAEKAFRSLPVPKILRPAIGGAALSVVALFAPQVLGSGHGAIQFQLDHAWPLLPLALLLTAKLIASAISIGSGFRGGLFSSSLFLGCLFGAVCAEAVGVLVPQMGGLHTPLMVVGMGAVAAGIIGAPLTMVFLVLEGTGDFSMTAGVMAGVVVTSTIVRLSFGYSFSTWRFHLRGLKIHGAHDIGWLKDLTVEKLMRTDFPGLDAAALLPAARRRFPLGSAKKIFALDAVGRYVGMVDMAQLHDPAGDRPADAVCLGDLARAGDIFLLPQDDVKTALGRFDAARIEILPVVRSADDRTVVGSVSEAYALRRYSETLERRRSAELGQSDLYSAGPADRIR